MASNIVLQQKRKLDFAQSHIDSNTLLEKVEQLVKSYENGQISPLDISAKVDPLIEELFNLKGKKLPLVREGLCQLLQLNVEKVQLELICRLKPLFRLSYVAYDIKNNQTKHLIDLEKLISDVLALQVRSVSSEVFLGLIKLYQDVLERLWLLPHLIEDMDSYVITEENNQRMMRDADRWLIPLLNDNAQPEKLKVALKSLPRMFQLIMSSPPAIIVEIKQLKTGLSLIIFPATVGEVCCRVGNYRRAIVHYFESLELIITALGDRNPDPLRKMNLNRAACSLLNAIGNAYRSLGKYHKAIEYHEKRLQFAQALGDRSGEGAAYGNLGNAYLCLGQYRKAIEYYEKALQIVQALGDQEGEGNVCGNLGIAYRDLGEYRKAIDCHEKALQITQALSDPRGEAGAYGNLGNAYYSLGDHHKAITYHEKRLQMAQALGDLEGEGTAYGNLGNAYDSLGDYRKAIEYHEKHLQIAQALGDRGGEGLAYGNLGNAYHTLGEYHKAIECHERALQIVQALGDRGGEARANGNLGIAYHSLGKNRKAIEYHEKALQIVQEQGNRGGEGKVNGNLGNVYFSLGEYRKAIEYHAKHLQIARALADRRGEESAYGALGNAYHALGEYHKAIEYHEERLRIAQAIGDRGGEGKAYGNLGIAYNSLGDYHKAIEYHEKALQIAQALGDRRGEGSAYGSLGTVYLSLSDYCKAIEYYEKGLQMAQALGDRGGEGLAYGNLGIVYHFLGEYRKAIEYHAKSLQIAQEVVDQGGEGRAFCNLGCTHEYLNDLPQAENYFRKSIAILSSLQHALGDSHQWKITIFEEQVNAYLGLERVLLKQNKIREALEASNARRARALNGVLVKRKNLHSEQMDAFMNIDQILEFVTATKSTYFFYSFCAPSGEEKVQLNVYVITASGEIHFNILPFHLLPEDSCEVGKIMSRFPFGRTKGAEVSSSTVPIITEMEQSFATKGKEDSIPPAVIKRFKDKLKKWYEVFIQPIEQYLPQERSSPLIIIPDGFLSQLPFAAFRDDKDQYLVERFSLSFAPSLSTLTFLNSPPAASPGQACIVSNPATPDSSLSLEESEKHVSQLNSLLKAPAEALFTSKRSTIEDFKQVASKARLIHIACHGEAGSKRSPDKFSVFEGLLKFAPDDNHKDGYLHAQEIVSLPLMADLVFLDACFSGAGKVLQEGSIGPIWSFHAAGASSVIGGLWFVPESKLIIDLIDNFYTHYLSQSMSKSKALHLAMTKAIEQERESPHLWGPLFLSGAN